MLRIQSVLRSRRLLDDGSTTRSPGGRFYCGCMEKAEFSETCECWIFFLLRLPRQTSTAVVNRVRAVLEPDIVHSEESPGSNWPLALPFAPVQALCPSLPIIQFAKKPEVFIKSLVNGIGSLPVLSCSLNGYSARATSACTTSL
jgi:hypothetical protein